MTLILGCAATSGTAYADPATDTTADSGPETVAASSLFSDSTSIPCAPGTTDLGVHDGYHSGIKVAVRLCAVNNLISSAIESRPGSRFYIRGTKAGANGHAVVNSRISGQVQTMVRDMKAARLTVSAFSTYRSMERQRSLCAGDPGCSHGTYHSQAKPGTSNHQMGLAIDFSGMGTKAAPGSTCATASSSPVWRWLKAHAAHYELHQYAAEPWHWGAASGC